MELTGKKKILVVDDEVAIVELIRFKLVRNGYEVITATNDKEFWDQAMNQKPDLIILDIWLREKVGTEIYNHLLAAGFDPNIPVIFITALVQEGISTATARPGRKYALYGKPFDLNQLMRGVRCFLNEKQIVKKDFSNTK